ncbi:protein STICHEL-like 3 isoform X2 [Cornus florida]|uniref:protein STICHEL-like 3 isoform X2 n=1 Tax=Cornus florida TaxID=4283 RepID=UPI002899210C|nr:protein STICHEL-like 3 isoform X2 [Cornus florida]
MTRVVRDRILKDANGNISDHLQNHIHLTNCIHLKNHMHKHTPILADRSIMKDLVLLQRSRSLRDPSTSPPSWHSPSLDLISKRGENDVMVSSGRRSLGIEHQRNGRGFSGSSLLLYSLPREAVTPGDVSKHNDGIAAVSDHCSKSRVLECRRIKREESSGGNLGTDLIADNDEPLKDGNVLVSEPKDKKMKQRGMHREDVYLKTLSKQLHEVQMDSDAVASSHTHLHGQHTQNEKTGEEAEGSVRENCSGLKRIKRRKFRRESRTQAAMASRDAGTRNEIPVVSESLAQGSTCPKYQMEEGEEEYADQNVTRAPRNGCGVPWNWSRIHHRGKSFLDIAGRSLSCGLSDPDLKKGAPLPRGRGVSDMPALSDRSSSFTKSDVEALPLLVEGFGSQGSTDNACWVHEYSGELGIFADNLLKHEMDSDLASDARSGDGQKFRGHRSGRHRNLTQKYMPRTFRDLVGQNLVAQALSNSVMKRKVGLLYVFYGPHGTGKTSCARIFARALNCQCPEHPKPCGYCNSCTAHDMGKSRNIKEIAPVSNFDFHSIMNLLDNMIVSQLQSYRVFIFNDCDTMSPDCWSAISKVIDRAPRHVVFLLVSSSLNILPHIIISRCQKFFFPKLKDADIIYTLQWIATKENIDIDQDALKLVASRSDGSLRDAEMTLEQLSLLGQRISVPLVQELVGLISDDKLIDLLDLALSADTVNTVKNLREILEPGIEPLALMSQLATMITDILAGTYDFTKEGPRKKFFRQQTLPKEDMEKLRQALKTLSEAEKQLRMSNDRLTWLTAAMLQLAPDQQYMLPSSSADSSFNHSPSVLISAGGRERPRKSNVERDAMPSTDRGFSTDVRIENLQAGNFSDVNHNGKIEIISTDRKRNARAGTLPEQTFRVSTDLNRMSGRPLSGKVHKEIEDIWLEVLEKIEINGIKEFMYQEGKLISVSIGAASTVQLMFNSYVTESKAEKYKAHILQAFESVLGSPVTIEIICGPRKDGFDDLSKRVPMDTDCLTHAQLLQSDSLGVGTSEIVEIIASPREPKERKSRDQSQSQSLVRSNKPLGQAIQLGEGCRQPNVWPKHKAESIAEKLEKENLRLEPRSRSLLCWKTSRVSHPKFSHLKIRTRKGKTLLKFVSCGKYLSAKSPRK